MASFQQVHYCKNCKTNVGINEKKQCIRCGGTQISTTWSVRFRVQCIDGEKQKRLSGYETRKKANESYLNYMSDYNNNVEVKSTEKYIFENLLKKYYSHFDTENNESTMYDKESIFNLYILPYFRDKDVTKITKQELSEWQDHIWKLQNEKTHKTYSYKYKCKIRGYLKHFLSFCEDLYNIPNSYRTIKRPKRKELKKEIIFWELSEFNNFIESVDSEFWKFVWYTFMFTGARFNEIRAFSTDDIGDLTIINKSLKGRKRRNKLTLEPSYDDIVQQTTKNYQIVKKQTPLVLKQQIAMYKQKFSETSPFLFGGSKPLSEGIIRRRLTYDINHYNLLHDTKLKKITLHGFRHSYVSLLIHIGVGTKVIAELIGDTEEQVIKTYGHLYKNASGNAISLLDKNLGTNLGTKK